jgi:putative ABC transport system permease protein
VLTVAGGALAVIAFVLLRTLLHAWMISIDYAAKDRLAVRNKMSYSLALPRRYMGDLSAASVPGIRSATYCDWFGAWWPKDPHLYFANVACAENAFDLYPEIIVDPAVLARWKADRKGAVVGDILARKLGVRPGDTVILHGSIYPGDWEFTVDGLYTAPQPSPVDRSTFFFHWEYKNDGVPDFQKDRVGFIFIRVDDPARSAQVSAAVDALFDDREAQTTTMSEGAANVAALGSILAVLDAVNVVSIVILLILTLILGNTTAMGVRERTGEHAILRAMGFGPRTVVLLVVSEAMGVSLLAAVVGLAIAVPLVDFSLGPWLQENMGRFFPVFGITPAAIASALVVSPLLGAAASLIPALRAARMPVIDALRDVT